MDVLKVFTDEPLPLDAAADEPVPRGAPREMASLEEILHRPTYARAYLAGSRLGDDSGVGLTSLADAELWLAPIRDLTDGLGWTVHPARLGETVGQTDALDFLRNPTEASALAAAPEAVDAHHLARVATSPDREGWGALRSILDAQPDALVLVPERAHDGWDWILYAGLPLRDRLMAVLRQHEAPQARRLVMPFQKARGEHKFYLERWALDDLPEWADEI